MMKLLVYIPVFLFVFASGAFACERPSDVPVQNAMGNTPADQYVLNPDCEDDKPVFAPPKDKKTQEHPSVESEEMTDDTGLMHDDSGEDFNDHYEDE